MQTKKGPIDSKPVFRSSAIFPAFKRQDITTRLLFLGYWMLKRSIKQLSAVVTVRDASGKIIARSNLIIDKATCYRIELDELLSQSEWKEPVFDGSMEIEFYSSIGLVFPYPAVVVNYYGPEFSSMVHTAQRTYNDYDDMMKNSETAVPESGFNIFADEDREPIIGIINGPVAVDEGVVAFEFYNASGELLIHSLKLGPLKPYQTVIVHPDREVNLRAFLGGGVGFCRMQFNVKGIFPRLLIGNWLRNETGLSVTHTYYDCSAASGNTDYWEARNNESYPASLMVPANCWGDHFTTITFYPIYSPSQVEIAIEFYDAKGAFVGGEKAALTVVSPGRQLKRLPLKMLLDELSIPHEKVLAARIIASPLEESGMPSRIKLGLDLGVDGNLIPCNICTNLQPYNPKYEGKGRSFKWAPLLADQKNATLWLMNSNPQHKMNNEAKLELSFFHEDDEAQINRTLTLPPQGFYCLQLDSDDELKAFFDGRPGWCTVISDNPYLTTYYFAESIQGSIGGDHGF
jgi:hypothetical protein